MAVVEKLTLNDIPEVERLFSSIIDELHEGSPANTKDEYKSSYSQDRLKELIFDPDGVYRVLKVEGEIVGFLFGWSKKGVGNIHWMGIRKDHRGQKLSEVLLNSAMDEFKQRGCYQVELFTYPAFPSALGLFKKWGFKEKAYIEQNFFGINVVYMAKDIADASSDTRVKKIVLAGEAGQGIKLIAQVLADILAKLGKNVALNIVYGPSVRSGEVEAQLIYSDDRIDVPFIENPDVLLLLSDIDVSHYKAKEVIMEETVSGMDGQRVSFSKLATDRFGNPLFINMIALGRLLLHMGINMEKVNIRSELPPRFVKENIEALRYGYIHKDYSGRSE